MDYFFKDIQANNIVCKDCSFISSGQVDAINNALNYSPPKFRCLISLPPKRTENDQHILLKPE